MKGIDDDYNIIDTEDDSSDDDDGDILILAPDSDTEDEYDEEEQQQESKQQEELGITGRFINDLNKTFGDHRFDNIERLGTLVQNISEMMPNSIEQKEKNKTLQWFVQSYIRFFAFSSEICQQFAKSLIQLIAEEKYSVVNETLRISPNSFTKCEIASQLLNTIKTNDTVDKILSATVEHTALNSIIASLISRVHEQRLHHLMRKKYMNETVTPPPKKEVIAANDELIKSFRSTKLSQVL
eukprot:262797_1